MCNLVKKSLMAKINHHNFIDTINDMLIEAKKRGVIQLQYNSDSWAGNSMLVEKSEMLNFGTCGYLGLEIHPRIAERAIEYTKAFGTQFSVSRAYLTSKSNFILEDLLSEIFGGNKVISFTSTTIAHTAVLPIVLDHDDLIILDQQCHVSIQTAAQLMRAKGVSIEMIRHNNIEMLESKIKSLGDKYNKIWYMIDGVYSMYGDVAPIDEINVLMNKYPQLHLYVDDAHGMSWHGKNGCGRIYKETMENGRTIYVSTLAKAFGTMGGIVVFPNNYWYDKVIMHGGPLAYSHPIPPPMMGASIASAEIHLSEEIYDLQYKLKQRLDYANELLAQTNIPIMSYPDTPIYFVGTGQPVVGYNLNKRILDEGFYVNIGMFPAVPVKNTGLRFTITNHHSKRDIKAFIDAIIYHYPKALEQESKQMNDVRRAFGLPLLQVQDVISQLKYDKNKLSIQIEREISNLSKTEWDTCFKLRGNFDFDALQLIEKAFRENEKPEENWDFYYLVVRDGKQQIVAATFLTGGLIKDDMISLAEVSVLAEQKRKSDPYWLCSKTLMMGSLFSEGDHLYLNEDHPEWKKAIDLLVEKMQDIKEEGAYNALILRDFDLDNKLNDVFHEAGFFKVNMPNSNVLENFTLAGEQAFFEELSARSRRHIKNDVLKYQDQFTVEFAENLNEAELERTYDLYLQVCKRNFHINIFPYPKKLFHLFNETTDWEFVKLYLPDAAGQKVLVGVGICYNVNPVYNAILVGIDYTYNESIPVYKQMLYQVCLRSIQLKINTIHFGLSADIEKKKLGAKQLGKIAYFEVKDSYNLEILENLL